MQSVTISGKTFNVAPRYAEGHTLNANEANALNQTFFENIRNNFAGKAKEGGTQEELDAYVQSYQFGVRTGGGGGSRDPVEVEAMSLARDQVKKAITGSGKKISDYTAAAISAAATKLLEKNPAIREKARERVAEMQSIAGSDVSSDIFADLDNAAGADEQEAEAESDGQTDPAVETAETQDSGSRRARRASAE
jgi:hypothetical protein